MIKKVILTDHAGWLENRKKYIGGSDAAAVLGLNPWKSNTDLWKEKTGRVVPTDISNNPNVKFGTEGEPIIRELFKLTYPQYEVFYEENNSWLNSKYPWAAVSHDGWLEEKATGRKGIWECKTTEIVSSMQKEKWKDQIPNNYYCQILHSFLVREDCDFAHLTGLLTWRYSAEEVYQQIKQYHIERTDCLEDIEILKQAEYEFWSINLMKDIEPAQILPTI